MYLSPAHIKIHIAQNLNPMEAFPNVLHFQNFFAHTVFPFLSKSLAVFLRQAAQILLWLEALCLDAAAQGSAIFFSTHVLEVAEKLCDKVAIIKEGKLIRSGTMEEVKGDDSLEQVFLELEAEEC